MPRTARDVVFVDGVRTPFGKAGPKGMYAETRADDLIIKCHPRAASAATPACRPSAIDEVAIAATTQIGDQGLTLGPHRRRCWPGCPRAVPGYSIDRMCAGAMTAVTTRRRRRSPRRRTTSRWPAVSSTWAATRWARASTRTRASCQRAARRRVRPVHGHDRGEPARPLPAPDQGARGRLRRPPPRRSPPRRYANGKIQPDLVPVAAAPHRLESAGGTGWGLATADEPPRPGTTMEALAALKTPFRVRGRVTAGNAAGLNDGATASIIAAEDVARELGLPVRMRLVSYAFVGVEPEVMGIGPVPATEKALASAGLTIVRHRRCSRSTRPSRSRCSRCWTTTASPTTTSGSTPTAARSPRPPAGLLRRPADDPAGAALRGAPRRPLRPDLDVHRHRHGRNGHLGEPATSQQRTASDEQHHRHGRLLERAHELFPDEVVTTAPRPPPGPAGRRRTAAR